jgi:hypothetical protein
VARLLAALATLPHLVPAPFERDDPREAYRREALADIEKEANAAAAKDAAQWKGEVGRACPRCGGKGYRLCLFCGGTGSRERQRGRRIEQIPCEPFEACATCRGSGRIAATPAIQEALTRIVAASIKGSMEKDPLDALKAIFEDLPVLPGLLALERLQVPEIRRILPPPPMTVDRVTGGARSKLKSAWAPASAQDRLLLLSTMAIDAARTAFTLQFLGEEETVPTLSEVLSQAIPVALEDLILSLDRYAGRAVTLDVTFRAPVSAEWSAVPLELAGRVDLEGVSPYLVVAFCYTPEDLEVVRALSRLKIVEGADRSLKNYPPRMVSKALIDVGVGTPARITARVRRPHAAYPVVLLELWKVEPAPREANR